MFVTAIVPAELPGDPEGSRRRLQVLAGALRRLQESCVDEILLVAGGEGAEAARSLAFAERIRCCLEPGRSADERDLVRRGFLESRSDSTHYLILPLGAEEATANLLDRFLSRAIQAGRPIAILFRRRRSPYPVLLDRQIRRELLRSQMRGWLRGAVLRNLSRSAFFRLGLGESIRELRVIEGPRVRRTAKSAARR